MMKIILAQRFKNRTRAILSRLMQRSKKMQQIQRLLFRRPSLVVETRMMKIILAHRFKNRTRAILSRLMQRLNMKMQQNQRLLLADST